MASQHHRTGRPCWSWLSWFICLSTRLWAVARHCALMVSSALYVAEDGRLFVAFRPPDVHYPRRAQSLAGRGQSPGRAGTCGPYQPRHDATLHRGGYRGQAQARRAPVSRGLPCSPCGYGHHGPDPCPTRLCWRWVRGLRHRPLVKSALPAHTSAANKCAGGMDKTQRPRQNHCAREPWRVTVRKTSPFLFLALPGQSSPGSPYLCGGLSVRLLHVCDCATDMCDMQGLDLMGRRPGYITYPLCDSAEDVPYYLRD